MNALTFRVDEKWLHIPPTWIVLFNIRPSIGPGVEIQGTKAPSSRKHSPKCPSMYTNSPLASRWRFTAIENSEDPASKNLCL